MASHIEHGTCCYGYPSYTPTCPAMNHTYSCGSKIIQYTIQPCDTLWDLAQRYNTTVEDIMAMNPGIDPYNLQVGQVILIPDPPFGWGFGFGPWFGFGFGGPWFGVPFGFWI